jgi:hypothetical protein
VVVAGAGGVSAGASPSAGAIVVEGIPNSPPPVEPVCAGAAAGKINHSHAAANAIVHGHAQARSAPNLIFTPPPSRLTETSSPQPDFNMRRTRCIG